MNWQHRINRSFKPRFAIIYPFGLLFLFMGVMTDTSLRAGIGFIILGLLIRLWSNGYAIKNDKLTTSGPYAFVRNPLYVGTFLLALGFVIVLNMGIWGVLFLIALGFIYRNTISDEQGSLKIKFGQAYIDYCTKVPAMWPTLTPYSDGEKWPFSLDRLYVSKEHKPVVWIIVLLIFFHFKTRVWIFGKSMNPKTWALIWLAVILIAADIFYEINRKSTK